MVHQRLSLSPTLGRGREWSYRQHLHMNLLKSIMWLVVNRLVESVT